MAKKAKIFVATDGPTVSTGFGKVSSELFVERLVKTGKYEFHFMATNDRGNPHPYRGLKDVFIHPLVDIQGDPYGLREMPFLLNEVKPDLIFSLNDLFVWTGDERHPQMANWFLNHIRSHKPYIPWIGYFPIDGEPLEQRFVELMREMTYAVPFSDYGYRVISETPGVDMDKVKLIYHGANLNDFKPLSGETKRATRKEMGINDDNHFLVGCFLKNTKVLMSDFSHKNIQEIRVGDRVINHKGDSDVVIDTMTRIYEGKLHELDVAGTTDNLVATSEHPIYSVTNLAVNKQLVLSDGTVHPSTLTVPDRLKIADKKWVKMEHLNVGDYILCPIVKKIKNRTNIQFNNLDNNGFAKNIKSLPENLPITDRMLRVIGYYLAEGSMGYHYRKDGSKIPHTVSFSLSGTRDREIIDEITAFVNEEIGFSVGYRSEIRKIDEQVTLEINGVNFCKFIKEFVSGTNAREKFLNEWVMYLPQEKQMHIYNGWFAGDGHSSRDDRNITITTSRLLVEQMTQILARNNILSYINIGKWQHEQNPKHSIQYRLNVPLNRSRKSKRCNVFIHDGYIFRRINNILSRYDQIDVYNFSVQNEESYIVNLCGVHNCISRNQPRKVIWRLIQAFKCFTDGYGLCANPECRFPRNPEAWKRCDLCGEEGLVEWRDGVGKENTSLYLHMNLLDMRGHRLPRIIQDNKLQNVITRPNHNVADGVPIEELNRIYNALDLHCLPSAAGGFELTILESQAAGTPNIVTRSTCMTEHVDNGKGFPIIPETHIVMEDSLNSVKHIISYRKLIEQLFTLYNDRDLLKSVIQPGLDYAKSRNWDTSAEQFDELFQKALSDRVVISEQFKSDENKKKIMLINNTTNPANLLTMLPSLKAIKDKFDCELTLACKPKIGKIIDNNKLLDKVVNSEKLWFEEDKMIPNFSIQDVTNAIQEYELNAAKYSSLSWEEVWLNVFKIKNDNLSIPIYFSNEDREFAKLELPDTDKVRVGICIDANNPSSSLDIGKWEKLANFLVKMKNVEPVLFNASNISIDGVKNIQNEDFRKLLAAMNLCDIIITMDNAFSILGKALDKYLIIIQGPRDVKHKMGSYEKYEVVSKASMFECMPCWMNPGQPCMISKNQYAACLQQVQSSEIFAKTIKIVNKISKEKMVIA